MRENKIDLQSKFLLHPIPSESYECAFKNISPKMMSSNHLTVKLLILALLPMVAVTAPHPNNTGYLLSFIVWHVAELSFFPESSMLVKTTSNSGCIKLRKRSLQFKIRPLSIASQGSCQ
jgi:hypothetical protein